MKTPPKTDCLCPACAEARVTAHDTAGGLLTAFLAFLLLHVVGLSLISLLPPEQPTSPSERAEASAKARQ